MMTLLWGRHEILSCLSYVLPLKAVFIVLLDKFVIIPPFEMRYKK